MFVLSKTLLAYQSILPSLLLISVTNCLTLSCGFFIFQWQHIGNKSYVFAVKSKTSQALLSQTQGMGFRKRFFY